jgi:hypothetical protein
MTYLKKCPNCGCDLEEEQKKIEQKIDQIIESEHGEALEGPRIRFKIFWSVIGISTGIIIGALMVTFLQVGLDRLGFYNPLGIEPSLSWFELSFDQLLFRVASIVMIMIPIFFLPKFLINASKPREERYLRKKLRSDIIK